MSEGGPTTGAVKVVLKLDTAEALSKVADVERKLKANEKDRANLSRRINKDGFGEKSGGKPGGSVIDKLIDKVLPKPGRFTTTSQGSTVGKFVGLESPSAQKQPSGTPYFPTPHDAGLAAVRAIAGKVNPFPSGGVNGDNVGGIVPTLGLAAAIYTGLDQAAKFGGLALAYKMKSGAAAAKTPEGEFFNNAQSTFSYIKNYVGSYRDAADRLVQWDDAVAAVTGKLPDTQFYAPKFQRLAAAELQFQEMVKRNAAWTRAGARGNSSAADQLGDAAALSISR